MAPVRDPKRKIAKGIFPIIMESRVFSTTAYVPGGPQRRWTSDMSFIYVVYLDQQSRNDGWVLADAKNFQAVESIQEMLYHLTVD